MTASQRITDYIGELAEWRGKLLPRLRKLIGSLGQNDCADHSQKEAVHE